MISQCKSFFLSFDSRAFEYWRALIKPQSIYCHLHTGSPESTWIESVSYSRLRNILIPFPSPQLYWYTQFNFYIYLMKKKRGIIIFFWIYIDFVILCTERRFRKILKLLSFDLFLNDEASIQLDASFEKIRTETLQNKLEEWKKTTPFFF